MEIAVDANIFLNVKNKEEPFYTYSIGGESPVVYGGDEPLVDNHSTVNRGNSL